MLAAVSEISCNTIVMHMKTYPIRVPRKHYRGSKPAQTKKVNQHNHLAKQLEDYINADIAECDDELQQFMYPILAADLGLNTKDVRNVLFAVDAGHNGITVIKPGAPNKSGLFDNS